MLLMVQCKESVNIQYFSLGVGEQSDDPMSDVSSQKSVGEDSNQIFTGSEANDEKKGEDSWTDVSLNDDSDTIAKSAKVDDKGRSTFHFEYTKPYLLL